MDFAQAREPLLFSVSVPLVSLSEHSFWSLQRNTSLPQGQFEIESEMLLSHLKSFVSYISAGLTHLPSHFSDIILSTRHSLSDKQSFRPHAHWLSVIHSFILNHFRNLLFWQMPGTTLGPGNTKRKYRKSGLKNISLQEMSPLVSQGLPCFHLFIIFNSQSFQFSFYSYVLFFEIPMDTNPDSLWISNICLHNHRPKLYWIWISKVWTLEA